MRKNILKKIFLGFFLLNTIFFSITSLVEAQSLSTLKQNPACTQVASQTPDTRVYCSDSGDNYLCSPGGTCVKAEKTDDANGCGIWGFSLANCLTSVANFVFSKIVQFLNYVILRPLIWLSSYAFDIAVYYTVLNFRSNISELQVGGVGTAIFGSNGSGLIYYLWGMLRDFLNIIIFFTIIYHAVNSMFQGFEGTRKKFIGLLVFSILANFSLLFVKIAIDISNIFTLQAYTLAVKPSGTASLTQFRTPVGDGPYSFGEYLRNSIDMDELLKSEKTSQVAKDAINNMQSTVLFQIGRMGVFIGLIYIMVYMTALLITRAAFFLYAMIISPLIAADIFFKVWDGKGEESSIAGVVRKVTEKVRDDFYDGLLKGPVVIFGMFLLGVLAESIFTTGLNDTIMGSLSQTPDGKVVQQNMGSFMQSVFIFFKFGLFFILARTLLNTINSMSISGKAGQHFGKWANRMTNNIIGRGLGGASRVGALAGQNVIGRGVNRLGISGGFTNMFNRATQRLNASNTGTAGRFVNRRIQGFADKGKQISDYLRQATYDGGNSKTLGRLGNTINGLTGVSLAGQTGKAYDKGYEGREAAAAEAKKKRDADREARMLSGVTADQQVINDSNVNFEGLNTTIGKLKGALEASKNESTKNDINTAITNGTNLNVGGVNFTPAQLKKLIDSDPITGGQATFDQKYSQAEKAAEKKAKDAFTKSQERSKALGVESRTFAELLTPTGRNAAAEVQQEAAAKVFSDSEKKAAEDRIKARNTTAQLGLISSSLSDSTESVLNTINNALAESANNNLTLTQVEIDGLISLRKKITDFYTTKNTIDPKNIGDFNKYTAPTLFANKQEAINTIINLYARSGNPNLKAQTRKGGTLKKIQGEVNKSIKDYTQLLPKEEKKKVEDAKPPAAPKTP